MHKDLFLGIDVGTTSVKAGLFDEKGAELNSYHAAYPTNHQPNGYVEQDPEIWLQHIELAIAKFAKTQNLKKLKAIGITSQVNTHVFVGADNEALAPAIVWQDTRCTKQAEEIDSQVTENQKIKWWGAPMPIDASHCLARMKWMQENQPAIWQKTKYVLLPKDYCIAKLTGEIVSDPTSNIGLIDLSNKYVTPLLNLVQGAAARLAPLKEMTQIAGRVKPKHPLAGIPIAVSTMDAWAGMFGVGVTKNNQAYYLSGTSEILGVVSNEKIPTPGVLVFPQTQNMLVHAAPTQSGGASIQWHCDLFNMSPEEMATAVQKLTKDTEIPLFLPHLAGERAPIWDAKARGTFLGLNPQTRQPQMARAIYEGIAFSALWLAQTLFQSAGTTPKIIHCGGGGFRSDTFNQIRADILGIPLKRAKSNNPGLLGAVALARVAIKDYAGLNAALEQTIHFDKHYQPDPKRHAHYLKKFDLYKNAYVANRDINHELLNL